jgi:hypothetical protein
MVYDISQDTTSDIIIPLIVFLVFIIFVGYIMYLLISSEFQTTNTNNPVSTDKRPNTSFTCPPGQCATNLFTGYKTCPAPNTSITIDPSVEVCNSPFFCDNPITPFALQSDGSTNINGTCEYNVQCPCLRNSQCPDYVLSVFTTSNGDPFQELSGQRITFPQINTYVDNSNRISSSIPPIQFNNPATNFCSVSISYLPLSNPGCNFIENINDMSYDDLLFCMGGQLGCSGFNNSPCLQGSLALITNNPDSVSKDMLRTYQYGCVRGKPCPCGQISLFDTNYGNIVCRTLN